MDAPLSPSELGQQLEAKRLCYLQLSQVPTSTYQMIPCGRQSISGVMTTSLPTPDHLLGE